MEYQIIGGLDAEYLARFERRFWAKVQKGAPGECWEWMGGRHPKGYGNIYGAGRQQLTHRLSYELNKGPIGDGNHICHHCDNPPCVNPNHLFRGTNLDNMRDKSRKGRVKKSRGLKNGFSKINPTIVKAIRRERAAGKTTIQLAEKYGIGTSHVSKICLKQIWSHV